MRYGHAIGKESGAARRAGGQVYGKGRQLVRYMVRQAVGEVSGSARQFVKDLVRPGSF